ncbi:surfactant protein Ba [Menidia menidia]
MAMFVLALLFCIGVQGCALTESLSTSGLQSVPDALARGDVCQDCTKIFELLADLLSNADLQKKIMNGIDGLCAHLPGATAKLCKEEVDKMLPVAITFVTGVAKPGEICKIMGLCGSGERNDKMLSYFVNEAFEAGAMREVKTTRQCSFCIFLFKTLEGLLPKERTEGVVIKLLEEICLIVPSSYRSQCETIVGNVSKTLLDALVGHATPEAICALIHMCKGQGALEVDPCTMTAYRCRDFETALKCGTVFYCQKFAWTSLN